MDTAAFGHRLSSRREILHIRKFELYILGPFQDVSKIGDDFIFHWGMNVVASNVGLKNSTAASSSSSQLQAFSLLSALIDNTDTFVALESTRCTPDIHWWSVAAKVKNCISFYKKKNNKK